MEKKNLMSFKHLLITRDNSVFWYIEDKKENLINISVGTNKNLDIYQDNLLCKRDDGVLIIGQPRNYDVIYVYEIIDMPLFLNVLQKNEFVDFETHIFKRYCFNDFVKQVYERI